MVKKVLAALGVGMLVSGSALASHRAGSTVTITGTPVVTAKWRESYVKGKVTFSATETIGGQIEASLRNVKTGRLMRAKRFSVGTGSFTNSIALTARPLPGTYRLRLKEFPTGNASDTNVTIPVPPEGVIDRVYFSKTQTGPRVQVFHGETSTIFVHFHFVARPQARTVQFIWKKPGNPKVRFTGAATKRYKPNVASFVCAKYIGRNCGGGSLKTGKWYAILKAAGRVTKRQVITVT
jgi:hypothetical protein